MEVEQKYAYTRPVGSQSEVPVLTPLGDDCWQIQGYQSYSINSKKIFEAKPEHEKKFAAIMPFMSLFKDYRFIDIGCSAGYFGIQALLHGARTVSFLDHDPEYLALTQKVLLHLGLSNCECICNTISEHHKEYDVGFALALVHWIYTYSDAFGSLQAIVAHLAGLALHTLFIEWIDPTDYAIELAQHIKQNPDRIHDAYTEGHFLEALRRHYPFVVPLTQITPTRTLYIASQMDEGVFLQVRIAVNIARLKPHLFLRHTIMHRPNKLESTLNKANSLSRQGRYTEALDLYAQAKVELPGMSDQINFNIQFVQRRLSKIERSSTDVEKPKSCNLLIEEKYYFDLSSDLLGKIYVKLIAFYLPQFHNIPENDEWWGKGFTEWTNTCKAQPLFEGHHQPRTPSANLGHYNLENINVYAKQVALAKSAGLYGFCFHFYWFDGKTLLEKPLRNMLATQEINFPFCLCWANENWTRRWDGQDNDILISQKHSVTDAIAFIDYISEYFHDDRYIKVDGKPVLVVYRPKDIPDIESIQELWRKRARIHGWSDLYLICAQTFGHNNPKEVGFNAAVQFPPHNLRPETDLKWSMIERGRLSSNFKGGIYDYEESSVLYRKAKSTDYKTFKCVTMAWDNSARRGLSSTVFENFTLDKYAQGLREVCQSTMEDPLFSDSERFVFINAWNEWGEGTYLEPDTKYGYGYLEATKRALKAASQVVGLRPSLSVIVPNYNHADFLERRLRSIIEQTLNSPLKNV